MAFRLYCPEINDAFAFLCAFIKNQTVPRSAHYPLLEHISHRHVRAVKWIIRAFTGHLTSIDAELSYDDSNCILNDYKICVEHFKQRGAVVQYQDRHYWARHSREFCRMMQLMLDEWFEYDDDTTWTNDEWFNAMDPEFRCGFIAFTECLESLSALIADPGRTTRPNYQPGFGNWCIRDSSAALAKFASIYQMTG